jgi:hypothetical protein
MVGANRELGSRQSDNAILVRSCKRRQTLPVIEDQTSPAMKGEDQKQSPQQRGSGLKGANGGWGVGNRHSTIAAHSGSVPSSPSSSA